MTVYVDDMKAQFGRMVMCHMIADTHDELIAMVQAIGVSAKWIQNGGSHKEHFDLSLTKKREAVVRGAVLITQRQLSCMVQRRKAEGVLGAPEEAEAWYKQRGDKA